MGLPDSVPLRYEHDDPLGEGLRHHDATGEIAVPVEQQALVGSVGEVMMPHDRQVVDRQAPVNPDFDRLIEFRLEASLQGLTLLITHRFCVWPSVQPQRSKAPFVKFWWKSTINDHRISALLLPALS
jgi:hypothetical protein